MLNLAAGSLITLIRFLKWRTFVPITIIAGLCLLATIPWAGQDSVLVRCA